MDRHSMNNLFLFVCMLKIKGGSKLFIRFTWDFPKKKKNWKLFHKMMCMSKKKKKEKKRNTNNLD